MDAAARSVHHSHEGPDHAVDVADRHAEADPGEFVEAGGHVDHGDRLGRDAGLHVDRRTLRRSVGRSTEGVQAVEPAGAVEGLLELGEQPTPRVDVPVVDHGALGEGDQDRLGGRLSASVVGGVVVGATVVVAGPVVASGTVDVAGLVDGEDVPTGSSLPAHEVAVRATTARTAVHRPWTVGRRNAWRRTGGECGALVMGRWGDGGCAVGQYAASGALPGHPAPRCPCHPSSVA